jgi:cell division protein FtsQ
MPQQISKKIFTYLFLLFIIGSINNKNINELDFLKLYKIEISGLDEENNNKILKKLESLKLQSLFFLDKSKLKKIVESNNLVEKFSIFKKYPSSLEIEIYKTKFLAKVMIDNKIFFLASNGKIIEKKKEINNIPLIIGNFSNKEFFKLKKIIDKSNLRYEDIKNLLYFPSGRWDMTMFSGVTIKLPKEKLEEKINLIIRLLDDENFKSSQILDFRLNNKVIVNE